MANVAKGQGFPVGPLTMPDGTLSMVWMQFLITLWNRSGGASGNVIGAAEPVAATASPLTYTPGRAGLLTISGGGVTRLTVQRAGSSAAVAIGDFYAPLRLTSYDTATVCFVGQPAIQFLPG